MKKIFVWFCFIFLMFGIKAYAANPKIMINKVWTEPEIVSPGEKFVLKMNLSNVSKIDAKDINVKLVGLEGKNALGDFSPSGESNEIYFEALAQGNSKEISIGLVANTTIKSGTYNMVIGINAKGTSEDIYSADQVIGIIVNNKTDLRITSFDVPSEVNKGEKIKLNMSIVNAGKGTVDGLYASFNNLPINDKIKYVGRLESGDSDDIEADIVVNDSINGKIEIYYLDEMNKEKKIEQNVSINIINNNLPKAAETKKDGFFAAIGKFFKKIFGLGD